jgi:hypothetical protein
MSKHEWRLLPVDTTSTDGARYDGCECGAQRISPLFDANATMAPVTVLVRGTDECPIDRRRGKYKTGADAH